MDDNQLRKLQLTLMEIFRVFEEICRENKLRYFLDGGTLLGAVRHQGFIPWDDDLDIGMPRSDYEKFCKITAACLPKGFFLQTYYTDKNYPYAFAKLRKENTEFIELISEYSPMRGGIYIDILPFDNYPDKRSERIIQGIQVELYKHLILGKHKVYPWRGMRGRRRLLKFAEYIVFIPFSCFFSHTWLASHYDHALRKHNNRISSKVKEPDLRYGKVVEPAECTKEFVKLKFENGMYWCPKGYDSFLKQLYGDYMKLPPVESRKGWHGVKKIKF